mmetsp:Transcript_30374/g.86952  ORF Transcript_30374/g.86952 Transcript_30374/m.86952 type:complete len:256 (+) Transcript_30374:72-839(+)
MALTPKMVAVEVPRGDEPLDLENATMLETAEGEAETERATPEESVSQSTSEDTTTDDGDALVKSTRRRKFACLGSCCFLTLAGAAVALALLWPRDPTWDVKELRIHQEDTDLIMKAFVDPSNNKTVEFIANATVAFYNPNFLGANVGEGHFDVTFRGQLLAQAKLFPMHVPMRGGALADTRTQVAISPELSKVLVAAVIPSLKMTVDISGTLPAKVPALFGLNWKVNLKCAVHLNVIAITNDPNNMVTGHECTYR